MTICFVRTCWDIPRYPKVHPHTIGRDMLDLGYIDLVTMCFLRTCWDIPRYPKVHHTVGTDMLDLG